MSTYRQPTDLDRAALRAIGHSIPLVQHIRCPNADSEPCEFPACRCHQPQPAECATELGADDVDRRERAAVWRLYVAALAVAVCAGVALLLPMVTR